MGVAALPNAEETARAWWGLLTGGSALLGVPSLGVRFPGAGGAGGQSQAVAAWVQLAQRAVQFRRFRGFLVSCNAMTVLERPTANERHSEAQAQQTMDHLRRCLEQQPAPGPAPCISLEAEVPEALFEGMRAFLRQRPDWDQYRLISSALAGFLFQNGCADRCVAQHYIDGLFTAGAE